MPRCAKSNQTIDDLKSKIESAGDLYEILYSGKGIKQVRDDLAKINVDFENVDYIGEYEMPGTEDLEAFEMIGDIPIAWCACGGDWEMPLVFCLYIDDSGSLRGYIPSDGNAYNHKEKCAFGSEEEEDEDFDEENDYVFDAEKLRADVKNRIQLKN